MSIIAVIDSWVVDQRIAASISSPTLCGGMMSPCRPRCRWRHWRAGSGTGRGRPQALPPRRCRSAEIDRPSSSPAISASRRRQLRFGVAVGGGVIAVDVAEIALPVDQRVAQREILREADHRVVDRLVAVRVVLADDVADDARDLLVGAGGSSRSSRIAQSSGGGPASARRGRRAASAR
jgi:hypothetical protein